MHELMTPVEDEVLRSRLAAALSQLTTEQPVGLGFDHPRQHMIDTGAA